MNYRSFKFGLILSLFSASFTLAQLQDEPLSRTYLGLGGGLTYSELGFSRFGFVLGVSVLHTWGQHLVDIAYSRLFVLDLSWPGSTSSYGSSRYNRLELVAGRAVQLARDHPILRNICIGGVLGISYNGIQYFQTESDLWDNKLTSEHLVGIPIGLFASGTFNHDLFAASEYRYHMLAHHKPYGEFRFLVALAVL